MPRFSDLDREIVQGNASIVEMWRLPGIKLMVASVFLMTLAAFVFESGQPGTPERPTISKSESRIRVVTPKQFRARITIIYDESGKQTIMGYLRNRPCSAGIKPERCRNEPITPMDDIPVTIILEGGSQFRERDQLGQTFGLLVSSFGNVDDIDLSYSEQFTVYPVQVLSTRLTGSNMFRISGIPLEQTLSLDNARRLFESPDIEVQQCDWSLRKSARLHRLQSSDIQAFGQVLDDCYYDRNSSGDDYLGDMTDTLRVAAESEEGSSLRVDAARPELSDANQNAASLVWQKTYPIRDQSSTILRASASYTDINREARDQSIVFLAGIMVGLATAAFPIGLEQYRKQRDVPIAETGPEV